MVRNLRWLGLSVLLVFSMVSCSKGGGYGRKTVLRAPWGTAPGEFGLLQEAEGVAPEALAVDGNKNMWILDLVNSRIQKFGSEGRFLRALPISLRAMDVAVDKNNQIILLAPYDGQVEVLNEQGAVLRRFSVPPGLDLVEGLRLEKEGVAITTSEQTSAVLLTTEELSRIIQIPSLAKRVLSAQQGLSSPYSERRFVTRWQSENAGVIDILDASGKKIKSISVHPKVELGSIQFLNEDKKKNFYILEELLPAPKQSVFRVLRFSPDGTQVASVDIENVNIVDVHKPVTVDGDGSIYFLSVQPEKFEVMKWEWK